LPREKSMAPALIPYIKPYQESKELCERLAKQGLKIEDQNEAEKIIKRYSYYRFKAYLIPFKNNNTKTYNEGSTFENSHLLYQFDCELRSTLFQIIEKIEVGVRSSVDQWITSQTNNPFWYLDSSLFSHNGDQIKTVSRVRDSFKDSKEEFAKHYREKYYNQYCPFYRDLPPAWVAIEIMTFGNVVKLLENITEARIQLRSATLTKLSG
jgi:abortive infection bacteriophage resistance protein